MLTLGIRTTQMTACGSRGPCSAAPRSPAAPPSTTSGRTSSRCPPPSCRPPRPPSTPPRSTSPGIRTPWTNEYYPILHFSELSNLTGTDTSRQFNVYVNGYRWLKHPETPPYLKSDYVYSSEPVETSHRYNITLEALSNSTLPPILNAVEIYSRMNDANVPSDAGDVNAMMMIEAWYKIKRNWMGDPCSPKAFAWDGINCTFSILNHPRITTLNLSSSGLTGEINKSFASLGAIDYLDLSHNNLTGTIPDVLAELTSLKLLDLTSNQLNGTIPSSLLEKSQNGFLTLRLKKRYHHEATE
ncbi:putative leucine-rich repeat receptor-like serine/threonine-protein kinase At2g19230 isoform X2 [Musa acuminata AAA Group]|uniref:putative leucine-rich repeat receptor-like serine/threonine-protein kinase At2g19230 isoform X2 n=1 Tax=Musa acuminata AAA Group TaxID=214697 RepID=UPI0031D3D1C3